MGLFSSKSSSSSSTTNVYNTDNSALGIEANDSAQAIAVRGEGNSVEVLDGGAINSAFGFAERNASAYADATQQIIDRYGGAVSQLTQQNAADLRSFAQTQSQSESGRLAELVKFGMIALAAVFVVKTFKSRAA